MIDQIKYSAIGLLTGLLIIAFGCGNPDRSAQKSSVKEESTAKTTSARLGEAPDFSKPALDGSTIQLSDYRGKVVLLNFWATWCGPCRREIPILKDLQDEYNNKLIVIGVALDEEGIEVVRPYAKEMQINYPVVIDDYTYGQEFGGIYMVPTTFIIDQQGMIAARKIGEITMAAIRPHIEDLLQSQ